VRTFGIGLLFGDKSPSFDLDDFYFDFKPVTVSFFLFI
jgi:hypothetical protein